MCRWEWELAIMHDSRSDPSFIAHPLVYPAEVQGQELTLLFLSTARLCFTTRSVRPVLFCGMLIDSSCLIL